VLRFGRTGIVIARTSGRRWPFQLLTNAIAPSVDAPGDRRVVASVPAAEAQTPARVTGSTGFGWVTSTVTSMPNSSPGAPK
jgi:hypothetical protein